MKRAFGAIGAVLVLVVAVLVALGQARAQEPGPTPPGPFPDVYAGDTVTIPGQRNGTSDFASV